MRARILAKQVEDPLLKLSPLYWLFRPEPAYTVELTLPDVQLRLMEVGASLVRELPGAWR